MVAVLSLGPEPIQPTEEMSALAADASHCLFRVIGTADRIERLCCMVHTRRRFRDAQRAQPRGTTGRADIAIDYFRKLYQIERKVADADPETRYRVRQSESILLLEKFRAWLDEALTHVAPKGVLGEALQYLHKYWPKLVRYCEDGRLPIDNRLENAIRPFCDRAQSVALRRYPRRRTCPTNRNVGSST